MNSPSELSAPSPPPSELPPLPPPSPPPAPASQLRLPRLSAAGWLASTGASLLLLASIVVVAGRWESITPEVRFAGLIASLLAVYFAAEALRDRLPTTASALAVLAATITAPVGIAAAATLEQPWPICILVGGALALVATEVQSRRWEVPTLHAATAVAAGLAVTGLAALSATPVAVLGALAAAVALVCGAEKRSVALAAAASAVPFLVLLADTGVGVGTLEQIGATGSSLDWSAPLASTIAAVVIAVTAHRRASLTLVALAAAELTIGCAVGLFRLEPSGVVWWSLPALLVLALQATSSLAPRSVWQRACDMASPVVIIPLAFGATLAPQIAFGARALDELSGVGVDAAWALPCGLTALALFASAAARRTTREGIALFVAGCLAVVATALTVGSALYGWDDVAALWAITVLTAGIAKVRGTAWSHAAAVIAVGAAGASMAVAGLSAGAASVALVALATASMGIAFLRPGLTPMDTIAAGSAVLALLAGLQAAPDVQSLVVAVIAAQFTLYAVARQQRTAAAIGALVSAPATVSLWWTTGTNETVINWLQPYSADGGDLALAVAALSLLISGALLRRSQPLVVRVTSWLAYSPGLGMAAAWLIDAQLDGDGTWATVGGLVVGVVAIGVGGWRRLGAPLVLGTALVGASVLASVGSRLAAAPTWLWIAAGGTGLLVLAALIERNDRPLLIADPNSDEPSLAQQFCREFD